MLANNFTKVLRKPKFKNYQAKLKITLAKKDIIVEVKV